MLALGRTPSMRSPMRPGGPGAVPLPVSERGLRGWLRTRSVNFWRSVLVVLATVLVVWASRPVPGAWKVRTRNLRTAPCTLRTNQAGKTAPTDTTAPFATTD